MCERCWSTNEQGCQMIVCSVSCNCDCHEHDDQEINDMFAQAAELEAVERHVAVTQGKIVELAEYRERKRAKA